MKHIWKIIAIMITLVIVSLAVYGCVIDAQKNSWGSFTSRKTESYDGKYYATQTKYEKAIKVTVYEKETDKEVYSFTPARSMDFWGICWESDSYNIWIQSGDIGVYCYKYTDNKWELDKQAERPADIISKYDLIGDQ